MCKTVDFVKSVCSQDPYQYRCDRVGGIDFFHEQNPHSVTHTLHNKTYSPHKFMHNISYEILCFK